MKDLLLSEIKKAKEKAEHKIAGATNEALREFMDATGIVPKSVELTLASHRLVGQPPDFVMVLDSTLHFDSLLGDHREGG